MAVLPVPLVFFENFRFSGWRNPVYCQWLDSSTQLIIAFFKLAIFYQRVKMPGLFSASEGNYGQMVVVRGPKPGLRNSTAILDSGNYSRGSAEQ